MPTKVLITLDDDLDSRIGRLHASGCDSMEIAIRLSAAADRSVVLARLAALGLADHPAGRRKGGS